MLPPLFKADIGKGKIITFGHYEQDNNTDNGSEEIEWQILAEEDGRALVISRYGLDAKPYSEDLRDVTWETSTLRKWLNGEFFDSAFSPEEKERIPEATNRNPDNPTSGTAGGNDTSDRIFLLSIDEAKQYFRTDGARQSRVTAYAKAKGANVSNYYRNSYWWLRSPGGISQSAAVVNIFGEVNTDGFGVNNTDYVVRPAFWLDLSETQDKKINTMIPTVTSAAIQKPAVNVGDIMEFGFYEQDKNTNNGPEDIEWQVLAVEEGRALVISRLGLDVKPYEDGWDNVTWETCSLRTWLNGEFCDTAFSPEEKKRILEVTNRNPDNPDFGTPGGNDTKDRIFLLSTDEADQYFGNNEARVCRASAYTKAYRDWTGDENGNSLWWLRSPGSESNCAVCVTEDGSFNRSYYIYYGKTVRPAFWLSF